MSFAQTADAKVTRPMEDSPAKAKVAYTASWNLGATSQYVFRGLSQTDGKPALQGGFDYAHSNGFYCGTWLSNITWYTDQNAGVASAPVSLASPGGAGAPYVAGLRNRARVEWDVSVGYKNTFATDWNYDFGLIEYYYPGAFENTGAYRQPNTTEIYALIGYGWLSFKYSKAISRYTFGVNESKGASYTDVSTVVPIRDTGLKVQAHLGRQQYPGHSNTGYWGGSGGDNSFFSYSDAKLGITYDHWDSTFGIAWTYAETRFAAPDGETTAYKNAYGTNIGRNRLALMVSKTF
jgi:uncharacterized protein (TIGR02001 family)